MGAAEGGSGFFFDEGEAKPGTGNPTAIPSDAALRANSLLFRMPNSGVPTYARFVPMHFKLLR
jgi:hypothetical protein